MTAEKGKAPSTHRRSVLREYTEAILIAAVFLWFTNTFVVKTFYIPSGSMEDTLLVGDHLFVNRFIYGATGSDLEQELLPHRSLRRGDVVIFRSPEDPRIDMVKRCIGLPGDEVRIVDKELFINGEHVEDSSYTKHVDPLTIRSDVPAYGREIRRRDNFGPSRVPEGHYFCLGDNRDNSHDSRFWGPLPAHLVKGRASLIYWSYGGRVAQEAPRTLGQRIARWGRTLLGFFTRSRWERTFHLVR